MSTSPSTSRSSIAGSALTIFRKTTGRSVTAWSAVRYRVASSGNCWRPSSGTRRSADLQRERRQRHVAWLVRPGRGRLDQSHGTHDPDRHVAEVELTRAVSGAEQVRIVVMVVLPAGVEGGHHRQPVADVHGVVIRIVVPPRAPAAIVRPVVLNHIDPQ